MGPLDTRVLMFDLCSRMTSSSSVDRVYEKGSRAGGSMGSSSVTSRRGVVSSLFDIFGNGGSMTVGTRGSCMSCQVVTFIETPSTFLASVGGDLFSPSTTSMTTTTTTTNTTTTFVITYIPYVML